MQVFLLPGQGPYSLLDMVPLSASSQRQDVTGHCTLLDCCTEVIVATLLLESLRLLFALTSAAFRIFRSFWKGEDMRSDDPMKLR